MERTLFLTALLCLGSASKDHAALGIYQTPLCISADVGTEPIMECRFRPMEASEIVFISWYKEGETLNSSDSRLLRSVTLTAGSGTLRISHVQTKDAGVYTCEMGNITHRSTGNGTKLEVHGKPRGFTNTPMDAAVWLNMALSSANGRNYSSVVSFFNQLFQEEDPGGATKARQILSSEIHDPLALPLISSHTGERIQSLMAVGKLRVDGTRLPFAVLTCAWRADLTPPTNQSAMEGCVWVTAPQEEKVATSVGINILLLRSVVGGQLLLTLVLAVIIVHFMSGLIGYSE